jgi:hypothetical protein
VGYGVHQRAHQEVVLMDIRPIELRKELMTAYREIDGMLTTARETNDHMSHVILISSKVQILHSLTLLNDKK